MEGSLFILHSNKQGHKMTWIDKIRKLKFPNLPIKTLVFLAILILLDFSIGSILKYFYNKQTSGLLYRATYSIDSTKADILIFGASRANHHYVPDIFENRLHLSCYNTGRDGETIFYNYAILKCALKRYSPKIAILDFSRDEFVKTPDNYDRLSALLPYYEDHPEIRSIVQLKSPYEKYKLLSKIYPYNSLIFSIGIGTTKLNTSREYIKDENGYVPLPEIWKRPLQEDTTLRENELDSNTIKAFESFISECTQSNIKAYIVISPVFIKYTKADKSVQIAQKIAKQYKIPLYDFTYDSQFLNSEGLYADANHLNEKGAVLFTNKVIDKILQTEKQDYMKNEKNLSQRK